MTTIVTSDELAQDAQDFLRLKRALGMRCQRGELCLRSFVRFVALHERGGCGGIALDEAIARWCSRIKERKPIAVAGEFGIVRQLCLFRRRRLPLSYVPDRALAPIRQSVFLPQILTDDEVRRLLAAATVHDGRFIWGPLFRALILVLYCTGVRLGEATRLHCKNVDLVRGILTIDNSKGRTRLVPIRDDLAHELRHYGAARRRLIAARGLPDPEFFFVRRDASPLPVKSASEALRQLLRQLGLKPLRGRIGPRPYELRHTFAVHRLTAWATSGIDVHPKLPWLSAYLGHQDLLGTEVYLRATPELLELASRRFEDHARPRRRSQR